MTLDGATTYSFPDATDVISRADAVVRDRAKRYPHPLDHFTATARVVTAYLRARGLLAEGVELEWYDWPRLVELDKMSGRVLTHPDDEDSLTDRAGYAQAEGMGWTEAKRRG